MTSIPFPTTVDILAELLREHQSQEEDVFYVSDYKVASTGEDWADAFTNAIADAQTVNGCVDFGAGRFLINSNIPLATRPYAFRARGALQSQLLIGDGVVGDLFSFSECWAREDFLPTTMTLAANQRAGLRFSGFSIVGDRSASAVQNGMKFYDRHDFVQMDDVRFYSIRGSALSIGTALNVSQGYMRESSFNDVCMRNCGDENISSMTLTSTGSGDTTNLLYFDHLEVIFPHWRGLEILNTNTTKRTGSIFIDGFILHGIQTPEQAILADLLYIGNLTSNITIGGFDGNASYTGYDTIRIDGENQNDAPYSIDIRGVIPSGNGGGTNVNRGRNIFLDLQDVATTGASLTMGADAGIVTLRDNGTLESKTYSIHASAVRNFRRNGRPIAHINDGTAVGGNARGTGAVDWQTTRVSADRVASGQDAVIGGGSNNAASGTRSAALSGANLNVSGADSVAIGGNSATLSGTSTAFLGGNGGGDRGTYGKQIWASGVFSAQADAQAGKHLVRAITTDNTPTRMTSNGVSTASGTNSVNLPNNGVYAIMGWALAREPSTGDVVMWEIKALMKRGANAASTALVGSPTITSLFNDSGASAWTLGLTADTTNGCVALTFTGENSKTIRSLAMIQTIEIN